MGTAILEHFIEATGVGSVAEGVDQETSRLLAEAGCDSSPIDLDLLGKYLKVRRVNIRDIPCDGLLLPINSSEYEIVLNRATSFLRRRFSYAHELGHIILHKLMPETRSIATRNVFLAPGNVVEERLCDELAGAILMPRYLFEPASTTASTSVETFKMLAARFHVSRGAAAIRMRQLGRHRPFGLFELGISQDRKRVRVEKIVLGLMNAHRAGTCCLLESGQRIANVWGKCESSVRELILEGRSRYVADVLVEKSATEIALAIVHRAV